MGRRKVIVVPIRMLHCYEQIIEELQTLPEFADFNLDEGVVHFKGKKVAAIIRDIDKAIYNLKEYESINRHLIPTYKGKQLIRRGHLAKVLGISRPTLNKWIKNDFITPSTSLYLPGEFFPLDEVLKQLILYQSKQK